MNWWMDKKFRMVQLNMRDTDALMDIDSQIHWMKYFRANVLMVGCGGITSFHPTRLEYQVPSPYMKGDFFGELLRRCHENGIRVIARFDFSKTHEKFYQTHPQWYSKSIGGEPIRYNDTVATCVNGEYQQECSLEIIREVITKYPVDGIFFNMFGYQTHDYSGNYVGICQCDNCKKRFQEKYGLPLPVEENGEDPVFRKYQEFQEFTVRDILAKIHTMVKAVNPEIAISTYHYSGVDMIRSESNSAVDRPYPFWLYASSLNVARVEGSFPDKVSSNCAINAVDIPYRFMGVSKYLNQIRLYEDMANGSGLDWCIIGNFDDYPDYDNFETVKEVFHFHARYENDLANQQSLARILLVNPGMHYGNANDREFLGIFKMLKEEHRLFDVIDQYALAGSPELLDRYDVVLLPAMDETACAELDRVLEKTAACVISTGLGFRKQPELLKKLFGVTLKEGLENVRGSYLSTLPKEVFTSFNRRNWVYLDGEYRYAEAEEGVEQLLPLVSSAMFGPPERCFGHRTTESFSAFIKNRRFVYFPWMIGSLYYRHGYEDFKYILLNVMDSTAKCEPAFTTTAPKNVEVFFSRCGADKYLLQMINLSGFNGTTVYEPVPMDGIRVTFPALNPKKIYELGPEAMQEVRADKTICVDSLTNYKAYLLEI
jgi:Uncharacterized protein conserved in bacteria